MEAEIKDKSGKLLSVKQFGRSNNLEFKRGNLVKCRTCLLDKNKANCSIMSKLLHGETIKKMMIKCVPQTLNSIADDNYICHKCLRCLVKCTKFIDSCLEIEEKIRDGKVIFEYERSEKNNSENLKKKHPGRKHKKENYEEQFKSKSEDEKTDENVIEIDEDGIESPDSNKIDKKQNELEIKGKRRRITKKIENAAEDEEIEAYLAEGQEVEEKVKSVNRRQSRGAKIDGEIQNTKFVVKQIKMNQGSENVAVLEITLPESPVEKTARRQKRRFVQREISPKMEIIDKTLGMVVRTYQRKRVVANTGGNEVDNQVHIENIGDHDESQAKTNMMKTYERKRNSENTIKNNALDINKISKTEKIDCENLSSVNEHTLGSSPKTETELFCENNEMKKSNDDSVHDISSDHDYIVLSEFEYESVKNITLLDENGELISVDAHVEDIGSQELPKQVDQLEETDELKCPSCQTRYKTKRGLCDHLKRYHNIKEEYTYHCQACKMTFIDFKEICKHKNVHGWPCTSCDETFLSLEELNSHSKIHPQIYSCTDCGDDFNTNSTLELHQTMHKLMMNLKQEEEREKETLRLKRYHCDLCPMVFRYPTRLKFHKNEVHLKLRDYGCHDCGKMFGSKRTLAIHHRVKHQDRKPFQCDLCGDSFKRADYLKKHSFLHHKTSRASLFPSEFCGMALKKGVGSKKNPYATTRKYACDICGLKFQHQKTKFVHERSHNVDPDKKFICPVCWKRLSTREELDEHSRRHIRISKKYKCWLCPMKFSRNMLLENHILQDHSSEDKQQQEVKVLKKADSIEISEDYFDENQDSDCEVLT